jgi:hypothetical protein
MFVVHLTELIPSAYKITHFLGKDKFMFRWQSKQGLCRAWVRQPGVDEFWEGIVGQAAPGDQPIFVQIPQGPADRNRYKLPLKALVAELLPIYT